MTTTTERNELLRDTGEQPPFKRGDIVVSNLKYLTVREGQKVRVLECVASINCGSGWIVTTTDKIRGPLGKNPPIAMDGIDSDWFTRPSRRRR